MDIEVILFDLGGVLIELSGAGTMMRWSQLDESEIWRRWLASTAVRKFESGKCDADEFARAVVREFQLATTPEVFMEAFIQWPNGLFEGAVPLLRRLSDDYHLSCLSNTNQLHWQRFETETALFDNLHSHFLSHQIGMLKPDTEIFGYVTEALGRSPESILFFDDNQVNVDAARTAGFHARQAKGVDEVERHLQQLGLC